jgi:ubiquinone/menaquinone biosynthesis C-methylase UbiE
MRVFHLAKFIKALVFRYRYAPYHALWRAAELQAIEKFMKISHSRGNVVIDAGCGNGEFFEMVKSFSDDLGKTCNVGLDISLVS